MLKDTIHPMRILDTLKVIVLGVLAHFSLFGLLRLGNRGEVGDGEGAGEGAGGGAGGAGTGTKWQDALPDDIKSDPVFTKYKEPAEAFRALVGAQKFLGRQSLPVPSGPEDKEAFALIHKAMGLPENPDGYVLPTDLQIPKDLPLDDGMLAEFKKTAHENGISPTQFAGIYKWYMNTASTLFKKSGEQKVMASQEAETTLRKEWGAAYPQNIALAKKVFKSFADDKAWEAFEKGYGNDPNLIKFFANLGKVLSEDQLTGKPSELAMTPSEAQAEIDKIKGDMKHPYWLAEHPNHKQAVERMEQLTRMTLATG